MDRWDIFGGILLSLLYIGFFIGLPIIVYLVLLWSKGQFGFENTMLFMTAWFFLFRGSNKCKCNKK